MSRSCDVVGQHRGVRYVTSGVRTCAVTGPATGHVLSVAHLCLSSVARCRPAPLSCARMPHLHCACATMLQNMCVRVLLFAQFLPFRWSVSIQFGFVRRLFELSSSSSSVCSRPLFDKSFHDIFLFGSVLDKMVYGLIRSSFLGSLFSSKILFLRENHTSFSLSKITFSLREDRPLSSSSKFLFSLREDYALLASSKILFSIFSRENHPSLYSLKILFSLKENHYFLSFSKIIFSLRKDYVLLASSKILFSIYTRENHHSLYSSKILFSLKENHSSLSFEKIIFSLRKNQPFLSSSKILFSLRKNHSLLSSSKILFLIFSRENHPS